LSHVCIDDASRIAFGQIMPDERPASAVLFLERFSDPDLPKRDDLGRHAVL